MEENTFKIYSYTNQINGKKYVGQTYRALEDRAERDGRGYRNCAYFYAAIQKYGWNNFIPEILEDGLTSEEANEREQYWIQKLNTLAPQGMNLLPGGKNHRHHELSRQKIGEAGKGRKMSPQTKEALKLSRIGFHHTEESKRKMSEHRKGKNTNKNRAYQSKPVFQYTKEMEFLAEFPSLREAERQTGINHSNIWSCCKGSCYSAGGYIWRFPDNIFEVPQRLLNFAKTHSIVQMTLTGEIVATFISTAEAARQIGVSPSSIRSCLIGQAKTCKGYIWKYKQE